jgi:Glycosyltransferase
MKVLFLTNIPSPYKMDFFNELGRVCDLSVLFERKNAENRNDIWLQKKAEHFQAIYLKGRVIGDDHALCPEVGKYIKKRAYDRIVIGQYSSPTSMLAILLMKIKSISYYISTDGGILKEDNPIKRAVKRFFMRGAKGYFSPGQASDRYLCGYGANEKHISRYPFTSVWEKDILAEQLAKEQKAEIRERIGMRGEKIILSVGQFIYRKGYDVLLEAAEKINPQVGIYLVGGKPTSEYLQFIHNNHMNNIYFTEFMQKDKLAEYYMAADIFVLPTREDIWGLVINEALAYGLPVITTDKCNSGLELLKDGLAGQIVKVNDAVELRRAINAMLADDEELRYAAADCIKIARDSTIEKMAKAYWMILKEKQGVFT